jgi:uncharacterized protein (DUF58 family)
VIPVPEARLLIVLILPLLLILAGFASTPLLITGVVLDVIIIFFAFIDILRTLSMKDFSLRVDTGRIYSIGRKNSFIINVLNRSSMKFDMELTIDIPQYWEDMTEDRHLCLEPGESGRLCLVLRPMRRGTCVIRYIYLKYRTLSLLFSVHEKKEVNISIEVFPDVKELNHFFHMIRKNRLLDIGIHRNRLRGTGMELEYLREYHKDDDSKQIEWKVTTRIQKPVTKVFQLETSNLITLVLDCGRLMIAEQEGLSALDYAINSLLILAHIIVTMGDMLSIIAFSDTIIGELPPIKGKGTINKVSNFVTKLKPEFVESNYRLILGYLRTRIRKRSLIIFFSDMIDDINYTLFKKHLSFLNKRHNTLFILLRDTILMECAEKVPASATELYVSASARDMFLRRRDAIAKLKLSGISVLDVLPQQVTPQLVDKYFEIKSRGLI